MPILINWSDEYLVGLEEIDSQHKEMAHLINDVLVANQNLLPQEEISKRMALMIKYTKRHFRCEEGLMRIYQFPDQASHLEEHRVMVRNVEDKEREMVSAKYPPETLYRFFVAWFGGHAFGADIEMAKFILDARGR